MSALLLDPNIEFGELLVGFWHQAMPIFRLELLHIRIVAIPRRFLSVPSKAKLIQKINAVLRNVAFLTILHELVLLSLFAHPVRKSSVAVKSPRNGAVAMGFFVRSQLGKELHPDVVLVLTNLLCLQGLLCKFSRRGGGGGNRVKQPLKGFCWMLHMIHQWICSVGFHAGLRFCHRIIGRCSLHLDSGLSTVRVCFRLESLANQHQSVRLLRCQKAQPWFFF
mmetsp:Transcript_23138/g.64337  ORF Transcript_23138/g.64337 Transcript_23138/m.64337 type:complete len:222 (+) Transcript_23138:1186-1851(+)